jgi:hypothetical protein
MSPGPDGMSLIPTPFVPVPYAAFTEHLVHDGWVLEAAHEVDLALEAAAAALIPAQHVEFLRHFDSLVAPDHARWFLSAHDYARRSDSAFAWDEFRAMSLDAAATDAERHRVDEFWNEYLPIALGVAGDYEFLAASRDTGAIVHGAGPEFEEVRPIAVDLAALIDGVVRGDLTVPLLLTDGPPIA